MGADGVGSFENDDAADWIGDFAEKPDVRLLQDAFSNILALSSDDYLELLECGAGVVAAEIVAALKGKPHPKLPEDVSVWVGEQRNLPVADLAASARKVLDRIKTDSEMRDCWIDVAYTAAWADEITSLEKRLE